MANEIKITALLGRTYAWLRINGWGLHARHQSAGPPLFSERDKQRFTLLGWRFRVLGPLHRSAPPTQRPVVCRSQAQSAHWQRMGQISNSVRGVPAPRHEAQPAPCYDEVFARGQQWLDEQAGVPCEDPDCLGPAPGEPYMGHARRTAEDLRSEAATPTASSPGAESARSPFRVRGEDGYFTAADLLWLQKDNARLRELLLALVQASGWVDHNGAFGDEARWHCRYCHVRAYRQKVGTMWKFVCAHSEGCAIKPVLEALEETPR